MCLSAIFYGVSVDIHLVDNVEVASDPVEGDGVGTAHHARVELVEKVNLYGTQITIKD